MTQNLIIVGTGPHLQINLSGVLVELSKKHIVNPLLTIDVSKRENNKELDYFYNLEHRIRDLDKAPLSKMLNDIDPKKTTILLGHANHMHVQDTLELLDSGFLNILLEKPYSTNLDEHNLLEARLNAGNHNVTCLEYVLTMKAAGLLLFSGNLKTDSFYFTDNQFSLGKISGIKRFLGLEQTLKFMSGQINELIGKPKRVVIDYLEGEGKTGVLDHRGPGLYLRSLGGGMIPDLFSHVITPILALEPYLGKIDPINGIKNVKIARANEYIDMVNKKHPGVDDQDIGETYAEIEIETERGIPVIVRLGKYTPHNANQRHILIEGEKDNVFYDLSNPGLCVGNKDNRILSIQKTSRTKYLPVVRSALEVSLRNSPFDFDYNSVCLASQRMIFCVLDLAYPINPTIGTYKQGCNPDNIFS